MAKVVLFVPKEEMLHQAHNILQLEAFKIDEIKHVNTADTVNAARSAQAAGANIIIARGYQASLIKHYTTIPVVEIQLTGQEMGLLITHAKRIVSKDRPVIGVVGFSNMFCDMTYFNSIYNIELRKYLVANEDELQSKIEQAINDKLDIIIGGDMAIAMVSRAGIPSLFLSSTEDSIREAFKVAGNMQYAAEIEKKNTAQIATLMDYSFSGIIKMNQQGNITIVNYVMQDILEKKMEDMIGKQVSDIIKEIDKEEINQVLNEENELYSTFIRINDNALVVVVAPIKIEDGIDGAILTCQKVKKLKHLEADILRERNINGYITKGSFEDMSYGSKEMKKNISLAKIYAQSKRPVLIQGEIGTEKELFAQSIHNNSLCKNGPYLSINCSGISNDMQERVLFGDSLLNNTETKGQGVLLSANQGTLYIGEIDQLSPTNQYRLYKSIRYNVLHRWDLDKMMNIEVRLMVSTTKNLCALVQQGLFREDLYYLVMGLTLEIPPLRKRLDDLEKLLEGYIKKYSEIYSRYHVLTAVAKKILLDYPWYGNLLQLESFCERMIITANHRSIDEIYVNYLIDELYPVIHQQNSREKVIIYKDPEALEIVAILEKHGGNRAIAAQELGISKTTLWRHMKKCGISNKYDV